MTVETLLSLAAFTLAATCTPGPNNIMLLASGMNFGLRRTLPHMLGISVGFPSMVLIIGLGIAEIFERYPESFLALKTLSAVYLLYIAWRIATATAPVDEASLTPETSQTPDTNNAEQSTTAAKARPLSFFEAASFQWVNPKAWAMALSAISLYAPAEEPQKGAFIVATAFLLASIPSASLWTLLGEKLRLILKDACKRRRFNQLCAMLLVASLIPILLS